MVRMRLLILVVGVCLGGLLAPGVIMLGVCSTASSCSEFEYFYGSYGVVCREWREVVHAVRDRAFLPGPAGIWEAGESLLLALLLAVVILSFGPILLGCWLSGLLFFALCAYSV